MRELLFQGIAWERMEHTSLNLCSVHAYVYCPYVELASWRVAEVSSTPRLTTGKRDVGRTQGTGKDIRGKMRRELREMRREGEREGLMGAPRSFLASPHR